MNYLGHAVFTDGPEDVFFGAITGDLLKGVDPLSLPSGVRAGLHLHKELDRYFDGLDTTLNWQSALHGTEDDPIVRHYANGVYDVVVDHIIASHWNKLFAGDIREFTGAFADAAFLEGRHVLVPEKRYSRHTLLAMIENDWMASYVPEEGLQAALTRLSNRSKRRGHMIRDNIPRVMDMVPAITPDVLADIPQIRAHMTQEMNRLILYQPELRLRWKADEMSRQEQERPSFVEK